MWLINEIIFFRFLQSCQLPPQRCVTLVTWTTTWLVWLRPWSPPPASTTWWLGTLHLPQTHRWEINKPAITYKALLNFSLFNTVRVVILFSISYLLIYLYMLCTGVIVLFRNLIYQCTNVIFLLMNLFDLIYLCMIVLIYLTVNVL